MAIHYTEPFQMLLTGSQRRLLENYKAQHGSSFNFIVNQALKEFFLNLPETNPKSYETKTDYKRTLVRLTKEIYTALQEYSKKTNTAMSAAAVYATMKYIEK